MEAFIGTILVWPMNWAPMGWAMCDGTVIPITQNQALFALIGNTYGGNGTTTFALPNLCGRMPIGIGQGTGLTPREIGKTYGAENSALTTNNLPAHTHTLAASSQDNASLTQAPAAGWTLGAAASVSGARPPVTTPVNMYNAAPPTAPVASAPTSVAGNPAPAPVATIPPSLGLNFIICMNGIFPSRQ